jgi:hypothetical protein
MSEKSKQLLENLKAITKKAEPDNEAIRYDHIFSNLDGDRIYGSINGKIELVNRDNSTYRGKINKRSTTVKGLDGNNFRSYVYETADGRWFDRAGMPIKKPTNLVGDKDDTGEEGSTIEVIKERTDDDAERSL